MKRRNQILNPLNYMIVKSNRTTKGIELNNNVEKIFCDKKSIVWLVKRHEKKKYF